MSQSSQVALPFLPFHAIARDGIERLIDFVNHDPFTFFVNGEHHASTVAEAISLSPVIHESLRSNPLHTAFSFRGASVNASDFGHFVAFAPSRDSVAASRERPLSFVSISGRLGNDRLAFVHTWRGLWRLSAVARRGLSLFV
jgi:hypothetical protein